MNIPLLIVVLYICCLILIGLYSVKFVKGKTTEFLLAGRSWPWYMVAFMLTGLAVGGASTIGCAQMAFEKGLVAGWYDVAWGFGALLMGFFGASRWRKMNVTTIPEMLGYYYPPSARVIGVLLQFFIVLVILHGGVSRRGQHHVERLEEGIQHSADGQDKGAKQFPEKLDGRNDALADKLPGILQIHVWRIAAIWWVGLVGHGICS